MNNLNDRDEVGDLLHQGYGADGDPGFAASLLTRLQEEMRPRPMHRWMVRGAIAASVAILFGVVAIIYCLHAGPSAPLLVETPADEVGQLVVSGRILKWDAPIAKFAVSQVIRGKVNAPIVYVDLSADMHAMRRYVREELPKGATTLPVAADLSARATTLFATQLNLAAGRNMVIELRPRSGGRRLERQGRILSWEGVPDLPPRDQHYDIRKTIINVIADGSAATLRPHSGNLLRDEWGMLR
jgi:hypothetical protein